MFKRSFTLQKINCMYRMTQAVSIQESALSEKCILVSESDTIIGEGSKKECHSVLGKGLLLHRAFSVFLFNTKNELLLQKRSDSKVTFPGHITNTCCSHPLYDIVEERMESGGMGIKQAARRRLEIELGIPKEMIHPEDLHYITRILYKSKGDGIWGEYEIDYILLIKKDFPIKPNPHEVSKIMYVSKNNFDKFLKESTEPITPWFNLIIDNGLKTWWNNIDNVDNFKDHVTIHRFDN